MFHHFNSLQYETIISKNELLKLNQKGFLYLIIYSNEICLFDNNICFTFELDIMNFLYIIHYHLHFSKIVIVYYEL